MTHLHRAIVALLVIAAVGGCSSSAGGTLPPPASSSGPSAAVSAGGGTGSLPAAGAVTTPDEAALRVIALDPRFAGLQPRNPDLIGACCFYEATQTADGFQVMVEFGWGDCPSGCISHHRWTYSVKGDGTATLEAETGEPVPSGFPAGGSGSSGY